MLESMTKEIWESCLNKNFQVEFDDQRSIELTLVDVSGFGRRFNGRESFSLVFQGPLEPALAQRMYRMNRQTMGQWDIFLVPIRIEAGGLQYEAVFT